MWIKHIDLKLEQQNQLTLMPGKLAEKDLMYDSHREVIKLNFMFPHEHKYTIWYTRDDVN